MVTFKLIEETEDFLLYWYYPNGDEKTHGIIAIDKLTGNIELRASAPGDKGRSGQIPMYAFHAIRRIAEAWTKGVALKEGEAIRY